MDFPDPLLPLITIVHHSQQVFYPTSCISTELLWIGSSWLPHHCSSAWGGPQKYITYEHTLTSPACPTCLAHLTWMVFEMVGRCLYSCSFVGCCLLDWFNTARNILVQLPLSFLSICLIGVHGASIQQFWYNHCLEKTALYFIW